MDDFLVILLFALLIITASLGFKIFFRKKSKIEIESSVLLEKVKKICKLITVQGNFTEIVNYQDSKNSFFNLVAFRKKALLIVKAQTLVGFDLAKIKIKADVKTKKIILTDFPDPEIISIDTDIQYYDLKQSQFNKFSSEEYTKLNQKAKETITEKVMHSELPQHAKQQAFEALSVLDIIADTVGWHIEYTDTELKKIKENKN